MNTPFTPPQERAAWHKLQALAQAELPHLRELLADQSSGRASSLQLNAAGLQLDAARQQVTPEVLQALLELATESGVLEQAEAQRRGDAINSTENRAVLHMALRGADMPEPPWGAEISAAVRQELDRFLDAAERIRDGRWRGHRGQRIANVINIGIGGSDLGPRMAVQALDAYASNEVRVHFVSKPDAWALHSLLRWCKPDNTLFIVQKMKDKVCIFRALNADVARNFVDNAARFVQWAYRKVKMDYGVTFFKGEAIHRLIKALYKIQPNKDVAYEIANMASGKKRAIVQFGPRRK